VRCLPEADAAPARRAGQAEPAARGTAGWQLFAQGDRNCDFFALLDGTVAVADARGTAEERILSAHGRGRFLGFSAEFLQYLAVVSGDSSARGRAARDLARVVIADVREDPRFAERRDRGHLRLPGHPVHAAGRSGRPRAGMLSTHCPRPGRPPAAEPAVMRQLGVLIGQVMSTSWPAPQALEDA
jgi:hypothetical protein